MPPKLLADYLYLWGTTVVRQAIETARAGVSSGGYSSSYWCQPRQHSGCGYLPRQPPPVEPAEQFFGAEPQEPKLVGTLR